MSAGGPRRSPRPAGADRPLTRPRRPRRAGGGGAEAIAETGVVVPPRDPPAMAKACVALLRDHDRRRRLGQHARARALEYFTVDRAIGTFDEIYGSLAANRPPLASYPDHPDTGQEQHA